MKINFYFYLHFLFINLQLLIEREGVNSKKKYDEYYIWLAKMKEGMQIIYLVVWKTWKLGLESNDNFGLIATYNIRIIRIILSNSFIQSSKSILVTPLLLKITLCNCSFCQRIGSIYFGVVLCLSNDSKVIDFNLLFTYYCYYHHSLLKSIILVSYCHNHYLDVLLYLELYNKFYSFTWESFILTFVLRDRDPLLH